MFWWPFTLENWFGLAAIAWSQLVFFAILAILPFADRNKKRSWRQRPVAMSLAGVLLVVLIALTFVMILTPAEVHLG